MQAARVEMIYDVVVIQAPPCAMHCPSLGGRFCGFTLAIRPQHDALPVFGPRGAYAKLRPRLSSIRIFRPCQHDARFLHGDDVACPS
jgi:hypothetical protein